MDNITLSDLEVKNTLDNSDKILIRDSNNVDKVIQGSAVESRITDALADYNKYKYDSSINDFNDCLKSDNSYYMMNGLKTNTPLSTDSWYYVSTEKTSNSIDNFSGLVFAKQIAINNVNNMTFIRLCNAGTWGSWEKLATISDLTIQQTSTRGAIYYKSNEIVNVISIAWNYLSDIVPEGFRPSSLLYIPVISSTGVACTVTLNTNGIFECFQGSLSGGFLMNAVWRT